MGGQFYLGLDIGSTTVKATVLDDCRNVLFRSYRRHYSDIRISACETLENALRELGNVCVKMAVTGSGGLGFSKSMGVPFIQEVIAVARTVEKFIPETDVAIELGGEDAKITYFGQGMEQRMNGVCAGGTGAFIDQMALLLQTDAEGLDALAAKSSVIHPIASRCGVFAKTDIQSLLNQGASREDVAASVFQAVVNQTIGALACGRPIRGNVAFLGGPLHFLPQLRRRFVETLGLTGDQAIAPDDAQYYAALGAAYLVKKDGAARACCLLEVIDRLHALPAGGALDANVLRPLFKDGGELRRFRERHERASVKKADLASYRGKAYLGIDGGSTTTKAALIGEDGALLYSRYESNSGEPVDIAVTILRDLYSRLPGGVTICSAAVTGYGEDLLKAALRADTGEVETMAHYKAAAAFLPGVEFILDIGGQDMKAIRIKGGVIDSIILNEACSSGCGSFVETFARSLGVSVEEFAKLAVSSKRPADLGNRCTVFMNSKVKQAQKEGVSVADISAGLSYSVVRNALYKVVKIKRPEDFGEKILAQGGTFLSDAVLRAFEIETGREAVRPDIAGLMGAYGAALIAKERAVPGRASSLLSAEELAQFGYSKSHRHCKGCGNRCFLTAMHFPNGRQYVSGNRCERGAGLPRTKKKSVPNLFDYKCRRLFGYRPLPPEKACRGTVGVPRVMNMYENYPFWHTFLTGLGFRVVLSPKSDKHVYEKGLDSIPSEAICYPAKLAHGHIMSLIEQGIRFIFYPCAVFELKEFKESDNNFNCPVVAGYPEVIKINIDDLRQKGVTYMRPFISFREKAKMKATLHDCFEAFGVTKKEIDSAVNLAYAEADRYRADIRQKGVEALRYIEEHGIRGIVVCGRPYHTDPEVNHGLAELITAEGMAVFTEDSVAHLGTVPRPLRVKDQWAYHTRLYAAASFAAGREDLELVQLTSFGCGLDAVTGDQVAEILQARNRIYTLIKIDEGSNLGAARIRIRSLKVAVEERGRTRAEAGRAPEKEAFGPRLFTREMKKRHTIIVPQMSPVHFQFLEVAFRSSDYDLVILPRVDKDAVEEGLKYVNNDACYPCIITTGQLMQALKSGRYDLDNVSILMSQTGGPCRATNYIALIRKALKDAHMEQVPVIGLSVQGIEKHPGFSIGNALLKRAMLAINYGDVLMQVLYRTRPYEAVEGSANALYEKWVEKAKLNVADGRLVRYNKNIRAIVKEFDQLPLLNVKKPRVGLVGEILVKFHPDANNRIVDIVEAEGGEAVMPPLVNFLQYCTYNIKFKARYLQGKRIAWLSGQVILYAIRRFRHAMVRAFRKSKRFQAPLPIAKLAKMSSRIVSLGLQAGEGWLLIAEMLELIEHGVENIICMQPFACLPNHITGRGVIRELRRMFPGSNIIAVDYDPGASETNQLNRIRLMMSNAK